MPVSKSIFKLIDLILFPVSLIVITKFIALLVGSRIYSIEISISDTVNYLVARPLISNLSNLQTLNSFADIISLVVVTLGFSWVLFKAAYLHNTHISPKLLINLSNHNLINLVTSTYKLYHQLFVWFVVQALFTVTLIVNTFAGTTFAWVTLVGVVILVIQVVLVLQDVYKEIELSKKSLGKLTPALSE